VSHSRSACGGHENIFYPYRKSNSGCPANVSRFTEGFNGILLDYILTNVYRYSSPIGLTQKS
jgi:hypothetical protein